MADTIIKILSKQTAAIVVLICLATPALAVDLTLEFENGSRTNLVAVDAEESGYIHKGSANRVEISTTKGKKLFRLLITAKVAVYEDEFRARENYYRRFQYSHSSQNVNGTYHVFQIKDVVRLPIEIVNGGTLSLEVLLDPSVPGLTYIQPNGSVAPIDRFTRLTDNQHFGFAEGGFAGNNSTSPRTVCVEQRPDPQYPMITECTRWEQQ